MFERKTFAFPNITEYEYHFPGVYGAKGETRGERRKRTPEELRKQNLRDRETRLRRLISANFFPEDLWITLKYPAGSRPGTEKATQDFRKFLRKLRTEYKKAGDEARFIYRLEIGKRGGVHLHLLLNRMKGDRGTDLIVGKIWGKVIGAGSGYAHFDNLRDAGGFEKLSAYIAKEQPEEGYQQLSIVDMNEQKHYEHYGCSRNLDRPEPIREKYTRRTVRKLVEEGPKPSPGYYIDKDSVKHGINPWTGYTYYKYTEIRIEQITRSDTWNTRGQDNEGCEYLPVGEGIHEASDWRMDGYSGNHSGSRAKRKDRNADHRRRTGRSHAEHGRHHSIDQSGQKNDKA